MLTLRTSALLVGLVFFAIAPVAIADPVGSVSHISCAPSDPRVAAALVDGRAWSTRDAGRTWALRGHWGTGGTAETERDADEEGGSIIRGGASIEAEEDGWIVSGEEAGSTVETEEEDDGEGALVGIAAGDDGRIAVLFDDRIALIDPDGGLSSELHATGVRGGRFDPRGRLWVAAKGGIVLVEGSSARLVASVSDPGAPVRGSTPFELLVPAGDRLWTVRADREPSVTRRNLGLEIGAIAAGARKIIVLSRGRIVAFGTDGKTHSRSAVPGTVDIAVDGAGTLFSLGADGRWRKGPLITHTRALDTDAAGRVWTGGLAGVEAPRPSTGSDARNPALTTGSEKLIPDVSFVPTVLALERFPGPPPCSDPVFNPLPAVAIVAGLGRGERLDAQVRAETRAEEAGANTWAYVGLSLAWTLAPPDTLACRERAARYQEDLDDRQETVASLRIRLAAAAARARTTGDPADALEVRRIRELISVLAPIGKGQER